MGGVVVQILLIEKNLFIEKTIINLILYFKQVWVFAFDWLHIINII
jgi:hypothetical protein